MKSIREDLESYLIGLRVVFEAIDDEELATVGEHLERAPRVFLAGLGRSRSVAAAFAVRLTRLGRIAHLVFEATSPPFGEGDLLIACSGSGATRTLMPVLEAAAAAGATTVTITTNPLSPLGRMADVRLGLVPALPLDAGPGEPSPLEPMQTTYEQSLLLLFDALAQRLTP